MKVSENEQGKLLAPTITLASIYEAQKQYFDSFLIYSDIKINNPDENVDDKIDALIGKVFEENNLHYLSVIDSIFSKEELKYFRILTKDKFSSYLKAKEKKKDDEKDVTKVDSEETDEPGAEVEFKLEEADSEKELKTEKKENSLPDFLADIKVSDLIEILSQLDNKDKKISDLSLKDVFEIIVKITK